MIDIKITKLFFDPNKLQDIYMLSFQIDGEYYNIPLTKDQFDKVYVRLKSIYDNITLD